ncbi:MAG: hypothetical protein GY832_05115 [Chloroflexi bacterium]|nr:hypothetical protein [Chloroflexota bacterium]
MARRTGLLARTALGAAAGVMKGLGEAIASEGQAKKAAMMRRLEQGERFNFETLKLEAANAAQAARDKTNQDYTSAENEKTRQANLTLEGQRHANRMFEAGTAQDFKADENALAREATGKQNQMNRDAKGATPVGAPFAGEDGTLYQRNNGGETMPVSVDGKTIRAPKDGFSEKDRIDMLLREAKRLREANANVMGDKDEDTIMSEAHANVMRALGMGKTPSVGQPDMMQAGVAKPTPDHIDKFVIGQLYQTKRGPMRFLGLREDGTPQWMISGGGPSGGGAQTSVGLYDKAPTGERIEGQAAHRHHNGWEG